MQWNGRLVVLLVIIAALVAGLTPLDAQTQVGTAFSYQGRLTEAGSPATGAYDLQFTLYDSATNGSQVGGTVTLPSVAVAGGVFSVLLDFGAGPFVGNARWLEVGVRPGGTSGAYATIAPRQQLTPSPYALDAQRFAGNLPATFVTQAQVAAAGFATLSGGQTFSGANAFSNAANSFKGAVTLVTVTDACAPANAGTIRFNGFMNVAELCTGSAWVALVTEGVPAGAVMHFNLSACPSGWSELTVARGRYLIALNAGGTLGMTVGTALTNGQNPTHTHTLPGGGFYTAGAGTYAASSTTTAESHVAPYIQLLLCQKS